MEEDFRTRLVDLLSSAPAAGNDDEETQQALNNRETAVSELISDLFKQQDEAVLVEQSDFVDLVFDLIEESSATWLKNLEIIVESSSSEENFPLVKRLLEKIPRNLERIDIFDDHVDFEIFSVVKEQDGSVQLYAYDPKALHYLEVLSQSNAVDQCTSLHLHYMEPHYRLPEILARFADTLQKLRICDDNVHSDLSYHVILYMLLPTMKCLKSFSLEGIELPLDIANRIPLRHLEKLEILCDNPGLSQLLPNHPMPSQLKEIRMHRLNDQQVLQILQQVPGLIEFQCSCLHVTSEPRRFYPLGVIADAVEQHSSIQCYKVSFKYFSSDGTEPEDSVVFKKSVQRINLHTHKNALRSTFGETWQQSLSAAYLPFLLRSRLVPHYHRVYGSDPFFDENRNYWLLRQVPHLLCKEESHGSYHGQKRPKIV